MDDKSNSDIQKEEKLEENKINESVNRENAGPSGATLPGTVQSPKIRPGLSKSEHNIRKAITTQDLTNALKSLSFGTPTQAIKNMNIKDIREVPLQTVQTVQTAIESIANETQELPNASCNVQTECLPVLTVTNEVIVTSIEPKVLKDKKKTSGSLSERSDVAVAQRDSLSSIGSNVCRICMTRGRERQV